MMDDYIAKQDAEIANKYDEGYQDATIKADKEIDELKARIDLMQEDIDTLESALSLCKALHPLLRKHREG